MSAFRLDRWLTLGLFQPLRRVGFGGDEIRLPVLMYHSVSDREEGPVSDYFKLCTRPRQFRLQMETLKQLGYTVTDLETGLARLTGGNTNGGRLAVLTFDDGFRDFHTEALPILASFGFSATMFLPTAFIRDERRTFKDVECMSWSEVIEAQKYGVRFGAHTVSHAKLYDLPWPKIEAEVRDCRADMEDHLGKPVTSFAYPYAFPQTDQEFGSRFRETLVASGYECCVTTIAGRVAAGDDPFTLRRLPINGSDDPPLFCAKLAGSYDWMEPAQRVVKRFKTLKASGRRSRALG